MTGGTLSRAGRTDREPQRRARARAVADRDADVVPQPDRRRRAAQHARRRREGRPRRPVLDRIAQRRALRIVTLRAEVILRAHVHPGGGRAGNGGPLVGSLGLGLRRHADAEERQHADQHRQAHRAGNIRLKHVDSLDARTSMAKLAVRACVLRALVSRKGSGATGVRQAGFTRTVCSVSSPRGNPAIRERCNQRVKRTGGFASPPFDGFALGSTLRSVPPARNVTYRAGPHRRRADSGKAIRVEDDGKKLEGEMRDPRHAFEIIPAA